MSSVKPVIRVAFYDAKCYMRDAFNSYIKSTNLPCTFQITWIDEHLLPSTVDQAKDCQVVCVFVNDVVSGETAKRLKSMGCQMIAIRAAGFNNVDIGVCADIGLSVSRVPAYSPAAVAEHALALFMCVNRKLHHAWSRTVLGNFSLNGLTGHDVKGKTVGVIGTGQIGYEFVRIMLGLNCKILCYDVYPNPNLKNTPNVTYVDLDTLFRNSDIISLHAPLLPSTRHIINEENLEKMKQGVYIINTSRGALVDTAALIKYIKKGKIGGAGLDVYEEESAYFFEDKSEDIIADDQLVRLLHFPNVIVSAHQAFLTHEALFGIASTTVTNMIEVVVNGKTGEKAPNNVRPTKAKL